MAGPEPMSPEQLREKLASWIRDRMNGGCRIMSDDCKCPLCLVDALVAHARPAAASADEPRKVKPPRMGPPYDPVVEANRDLIKPVAHARAQETPTLTCAHCGQPAACFGEYETCDGTIALACDACCGHGNEDGWCRPIAKLFDYAAEIARKLHDQDYGVDGAAPPTGDDALVARLRAKADAYETSGFNFPAEDVALLRDAADRITRGR
jgi:hypothetical protein